jgi:tight adherence protein B
MDSSDLLLPGLLLLAALSIGTMVYLLLNPYLSRARPTDKRIQGVTESKATRVAVRAQADAVQNRRRPVSDTLRQLEEREKTRSKAILRVRLQRAGLDIAPRSF